MVFYMAAAVTTIMSDGFQSALIDRLKTYNYTETTPYVTPVPANNDFFRLTLAHLWQMRTVWSILFTLLVGANLKCVPFVWHLRILNGMSRTLKTQRPAKPPTYSQIFQPLITNTHVPLLEIDFNMHKTNSSYFADVDIARSHLVCTLFSRGIEYCRGGTGIYTYTDKPIFSLALGAVSCNFKRELKAYDSYELWTRILAWDEKWIYIVTHFVRKGMAQPKDYTLYPEQNPDGHDLSESEGEKLAELQANADSLSAHPGVVATALSKCVFKEGRRTVSPAFMLRKSGILPSLSEDKPINGEDLSGASSDCESLNVNSCESSDSGTAVGSEEEESASDQVEKERARGLEIARSLSKSAQEALEKEFTGSRGSALGRHQDGIGFIGVARCAILLLRGLFIGIVRQPSKHVVTGKGLGPCED